MTKPLVSKGALADKKRRQVRTTGVNRIGKRTTVPRQNRPSAKRPRYRKSAAAAGFSAMLGALFVATSARRKTK